jgi:hypothetical protein
MLKYAYDSPEQEIKAWIDPTSGSLNFQIEKETVTIPYEIGYEMVMVLKQKQSIFQEEERRKENVWSRMMSLLTKQPKESVTQLKGHRYEVA